MKILEQILEEIEEMPYPSEGIGCGLEDAVITDRYEAVAYGWNEAVERIGEIIRSHMEDGTKGLIDFEDERLWNILYEEACVEGAQAERISKRLKEICVSRAQNDGWIPVKERLPEAIGRYLVTALWEDGDYKKYSVYDASYGSDGIWHTANYAPVPYRVIAWRPLPEPYRPKEE